MRQIWITRAGGPEVLEVREAPDPTPGEGEVRIVVEAAGVNFADLVARTGMYQDAPPIPFVVGYEVSGTIDAVGKGVPESRVGEPVIAMCRFGGYSSMRVVPAAQAVRRPAGMSAVEGASIPVAYMTAWMMLRVFTRPSPGERVFVHSAGGGVGLAALDLLIDSGCETWGSAGKGKHALLKQRGYTHVVDGHASEWPPEKMDIVLDAVGGASWAQGLDHLRAGGRLVCFGFSTMTGETRSVWSALKGLASVPWLRINPITLMNENKGVLGVNMGHLWDEGERVGHWLGSILELYEQGKIRPQVHAAFPFDKAGEAHSVLHRRENFGKVVLVP